MDSTLKCTNRYVTHPNRNLKKTKKKTNTFSACCVTVVKHLSVRVVTKVGM